MTASPIILRLRTRRKPRRDRKQEAADRIEKENTKNTPKCVTVDELEGPLPVHEYTHSVRCMFCKQEIRPQWKKNAGFVMSCDCK